MNEKLPEIFRPESPSKDVFLLHDIFKTRLDIFLTGCCWTSSPGFASTIFSDFSLCSINILEVFQYANY